MVLSSDAGGADRAGAPRPRAPDRSLTQTARTASAGTRGSQSLETALALPFAVLFCVLVLHAGIAATDLVVAQTLAREAARLASVDDDTAVRARLAEAAGGRPVNLELRPRSSQRARGDAVTATLRMRSRAFEAFGVQVWLPAQATMRVEDP